HRRTTVKTRLIREGGSGVRFDREHLHPLTDEEENYFVNQLKSTFDSIDCFVVSDYNKGAITETLFRSIVGLGKPIIVDPKGEDFLKYQGATLIKPNRKEVLLDTKLFE